MISLVGAAFELLAPVEILKVMTDWLALMTARAGDNWEMKI